MAQSFTVKSDLDALLKQYQVFADQLPFATAKALTDTALDIKAAQEAEMKDVFDRPIPYTLRSVKVRRAEKTNLTAIVALKDDGRGGANPTNYLLPNIEGGRRRAKAFEVALRRSSRLAANEDRGFLAVPGAGARLDSYGNMSRGQIVQILSDLRLLDQKTGTRSNRATRAEIAARRAGGDKRARYRKARYFIGRPGDGKLPLGVYERTGQGGRGIRPVLVFISDAQYQRIYDFDYVSRITYGKRFKINFERALELALKTARAPLARAA